MKGVVITISVLLLACAACKKVSGPANGKSVQPNNNLDTLVSMGALINRTTLQTDSAFGYIIEQSANDSSHVNLMITGTQYSGNNNYTLTFNITNFTGPATYAINPPVNSAYYYANNVRHTATSGEIIITSNSPYGLIGTFDLIADTIRVVNGSFNVAQP